MRIIIAVLARRSGRDAEQRPAPVRPTRRTLMSLVAILAGVTGASVAGVVAYAGATAETASSDARVAAAHLTQRLEFHRDFAEVALKRDRFEAVAAPAAAAADEEAGPAAPPLGPVVPAGVAQQYAAKAVEGRGWKPSEFSCLVSLWNRESGWNAHAASGSGAYGIPQAFPGSKMGAGGGDWRNDHRVQIRWGLGYISGRYGTPCGAWSHFQAAGSY